MFRSFFTNLLDRFRGDHPKETPTNQHTRSAPGKIPGKEPSNPVRRRARPAPPPKKIRGGRATWYPLNGGARKIPWGTSARASSQL